MTVPVEVVKGKIYLIRGQKVLLDSDLAEMYVVETKRLNEQVRRNKSRFPADFMFQLDEIEYKGLRSQFATLKGKGWAARRGDSDALGDYSADDEGTVRS